jgi:hypothetical protein
MAVFREHPIVGSSLLVRAASPHVDQRANPRSSQAPFLELARQLHDDAPFVCGGCPHQGNRERVLDGHGTRRRGHFVWANDNRLTRTYVDSSTLVPT